MTERNFTKKKKQRNKHYKYKSTVRIVSPIIYM